MGYAEDMASALAFITANPRNSSSWTPDCGEATSSMCCATSGSTIEVVALSQLNWTAVRKSYLDAGAIAYFDKELEFHQARDFIADLANARSAETSEPGS